MRHVTLKQLRALAAVMRSGSFAGAAEALHLTPPAVTVQMRQLEEAAGLPLVERLADGLRLTEAGREVLATVERIELALADCTRALEALRSAGRGVVSVGVISTAKYYAPRALADFLKAHPGLELKLTIGNRGEIIAALKEGAVDVAIMGRPPDELEVELSEIGPHPHVVIAPPDHPLAAARDLAPEALADETFLLRESGSGTRILMERFFAGHGLQPRVGLEMGSNETIKQAVMAGLGIAFISAHTIAAEIGDGRLVVLDVRGLPILRAWYVVQLRHRRLLPAPSALAAFLREHGQGYLPAPPRPT
ncbi:LysR family transcriptional regulator [Prosthecomicrobium sp. N25]|uniref:LysR family transcriptional regulator n=1 Tax=Prosthecomicrobium sp. N25 TaxID=3129254 RepID=UPI0030781659